MKPTVKLFADTADVREMYALKDQVQGFTTNPTLMRRAGVVHYDEWAKTVLDVIPDKPVSFEVLADDELGMVRQAHDISKWGDNVYVKIPVRLTTGELTTGVVGRLLHDGVKVNLTAICNVDDVEHFHKYLGVSPTIVSVFAGRIADTGLNTFTTLEQFAVRYGWMEGVELLWASTRQVYSIVEAERCHFHIVTVTPDILRKLGGLGRSLDDVTLDTVRQFYDDSRKAGYTL